MIDAKAALSDIALRVIDNGQGISFDMLPHVFDRFARGSGVNELRDGGEGTGLGLAIAKGIMEAHGGSIAVESPVEGQPGTRFVMRFPREDTTS